jgi:DNA-binding NarL/FixJ family response regulator
MTSILGKLGVASRVEAALLAYKAGLESSGGSSPD